MRSASWLATFTLLMGAVSSSTARAACGDATPDAGETCDDGNTDDGDGCSAVCEIEPGFSCSPPSGPIIGAGSDFGFEELDGPAWDASDSSPNDLLANNALLSSWTILSGRVDVVLAGSPLATPPEGTQALNLVGTPTSGTVVQDITTQPNRSYKLTFQMSEMNSACAAANNQASVFIRAQDPPLELASDFVTTNVASTDGVWDEKGFFFTATSTTTRITIADTSGHPFCGAVIDDLVLARVSVCDQVDDDNDGLANSLEDLNGNGILDPGETDPEDADTDDDGLSDLQEVNGTGPLAGRPPTDPRNPDTDGDGVNDGTELGVVFGQGADSASAIFQPDEDNTTTTDPLDPDTDDDGLLDGEEEGDDGDVDPGETSALLVDTDGDGLTDGQERGLAAPTDPSATDAAVFVADADPSTTTDPSRIDTDRGGIPDGVEDANLNGAVDVDETDPNVRTDDDSDGDGLTEAEEADLGTDPLDADTDDDGISDKQEINGTGPLVPWGPTDPLDPDTDDDGLRDGTEIGVVTTPPDTDASYQPDTDPSSTTDPLDDDSDDDGILDGAEDGNGNGAVGPNEPDPNSRDSDADGLLDGLEAGLTEPMGMGTDMAVFQADTDPSTTTSPVDRDTDTGGIPDGAEDANLNGRVDPGERDPNVRADDDSDGDGIPDADELADGTDPFSTDSDNDGIDDIDERDGTGPLAPWGPTDATSSDSDGDGLPDGQEIGLTLADIDPSESDGFVPDTDPYTTTDPNDDDSDDDGLLDGSEDLDQDGFRDPDETDPNDPDSDGDTLPDGLEEGLGEPEGDDTDPGVFRPDGDDGATTTDPLSTDTDLGGVPDNVEDEDGDGVVAPTELDPNNPLDDQQGLDADGDGVSNQEEEEAGTDPADADTDDDGISDFDEINGTGPLEGIGPTDPTSDDSDGDGLSDGTEIGVVDRSTGTGSAFVPDSDPSTTTDPLDDDTDDDGLLDGSEDANGNGAVDTTESDPNVPDTDGDGLGDGLEAGLDAPEGEDTQGDFFVPDQDGSSSTDPFEEDTDGDGLLDGVEDANGNGRVDPGETDPRVPDSDLDGIPDGTEDANGNGVVDDGETDPLVADTDGDALLDGDEIERGTDPLDPDTDGDGYDDGFEVANGGDPLDAVFTKGSGCSHSNAPVGLLGLLLAFVARRRRTVAAAALAVSSAASAQVSDQERPLLDVQRFDPSPQVGGFTIVRNAEQSKATVFGAAVYANYGLRPFELGSSAEDGKRVQGLVDHLIAFDVAANYAPLSWLEVGLQFQALQVQVNAPESRIWATPLGASGRNTGIGDLTLSIGLAPLRQRDGAPISLSVVPRIVMPTGSRGLFLGSGSFGVGADVAVGGSWDFFRFTLAGGYEFHNASAAVGQVYADDEVRFGAGVGIPFLDRVVEIQVEYNGAMVVSGAGREAVGADDFLARHMPMEVLASLLVQPKRDPLWLRIGGGRGLTQGFGTTDARIFAAIGLHTDRPERQVPVTTAVPDIDPTDTDGDGFVNELDNCPSEPEDFNGRRDDDGCPDEDSDGDRVPDAFDACPMEPEDPDLFADTDGCPEYDNDGDRILDDDDDCPKDAETINGIDDDDGCPDDSLAWIAPDYRTILISERVFFQPGSSNLQRDSYPVLDAVARILQVYPEVTSIEIQGFTDSVEPGDEMDLSMARAEAALRYLRSKGVSASRLSAKGYGATQPVIEDAETDDEHALNRRVQFEIVEFVPQSGDERHNDR
jgi:cysteine-rich repeat protein